MITQKITISAPGKVILAGEHAVVYGYPALVTAVNQRVSVTFEKTESKQETTFLPESAWQNNFESVISQLQSLPSVKNISLSSQLPMGKGMGSSAALAVCLSGIAQMIMHGNFDRGKINERAYELEKFQHGTPSGVDNSIATFGQFLWYRKESEKLKVFSPVTPQQTLPTFVAIDSGSPAENTKEMVRQVAEWRSTHQTQAEGIFREIELIARSWLRQIQGDESPSWKELIEANQRALSSLKVVSSSTEDLITQLKKQGAYAKVTGAGGSSSGSGILFAYHEEPEKILSWAQQQNIPAWPLELGQEGVKKENYD